MHVFVLLQRDRLTDSGIEQSQPVYVLLPGHDMSLFLQNEATLNSTFNLSIPSYNLSNQNPAFFIILYCYFTFDEVLYLEYMILLPLTVRPLVTIFLSIYGIIESFHLWNYRITRNDVVLNTKKRHNVQNIM